MEAGGPTVLCDHSLRAQHREEHFPKTLFPRQQSIHGISDNSQGCTHPG